METYARLVLYILIAFVGYELKEFLIIPGLSRTEKIGSFLFVLIILLTLSLQ